jgi:hypothetical protein
MQVRTKVDEQTRANPKRLSAQRTDAAETLANTGIWRDAQSSVYVHEGEPILCNTRGLQSLQAFLLPFQNSATHQ